MEAHPYTTDTSDEAERLQLELLRRMSPAERMDKVWQLSADLRRMAAGAIRRRHPEFDEHEVRMKFIELTYGEELEEAVRDHLRKRGGA